MWTRLSNRLPFWLSSKVDMMMRLLLFGLKTKKTHLRLKPDIRALVPDPKFNRDHNEHMRRNMCPSVDHEMTTWSQLWQKKMILDRVNREGCYDMATCWTMSPEPNMRCPHGNLIAMPTVDFPVQSHWWPGLYLIGAELKEKVMLFDTSSKERGKTHNQMPICPEVHTRWFKRKFSSISYINIFTLA